MNQHSLKKIIIAIDGPSGSGKSSLAKKIASALNYIYIDSGAMYRAVTYYILKNKIDSSSESALLSAFENINIEFKRNKEKAQIEIFLNNENIVNEIRDPIINGLVSSIASKQSVRTFLINKQQELGRDRGVVMDGRDIGTNVFPDAEIKFFLTAHIDIRAQRRLAEMQQIGFSIPLEAVKNNLIGRDYSDSIRTLNPLKKAYNAIEIDNSNNTFDELFNFCMVEINRII